MTIHELAVVAVSQDRDSIDGTATAKNSQLLPPPRR